jgi:BirA family transcriptional regulator, biotin operon repressor / biotin---[acetyl-CoA-carboxylase] ligase
MLGCSFTKVVLLKSRDATTYQMQYLSERFPAVMFEPLDSFFAASGSYPRSDADPMGEDPIRAEMVLPLLLDLVEPGSPWVAGLPFEYLARCGSTNTALKQIAESAPAGTVLITDEQTGGRGRLGRTWVSQPHLDLTFSVLLRPALAPAQGHLLALATGVAVAEVLEEGFDLHGQVTLKWPNDVLLDGKKVCGVLLEASLEAERILWSLAGIGLNVNGEVSRLMETPSAEMTAEWRGRPQPVSLREHLGCSVPRAPLLAALLARLTYWWTGLDWASTVPSLLGEWRRRDALAGRRVEVFSGPDRSQLVAAGEATGIGEEGQLQVRSEDGTLAEVFAGDVSVTAAI